ncbi:hypothetical protein [Streptomyces sp. NPDC053728]|uniref:hypothetical protein n=1 Tax=unclassified Streptomyces TaxID=2593676 RepID=UPI00343676F5
MSGRRQRGRPRSVASPELSDDLKDLINGTESRPDVFPRSTAPLHRAPFDRILAAQARAEGPTIVTRDTWIPQYDVPVMPA